MPTTICMLLSSRLTSTLIQVLRADAALRSAAESGAWTARWVWWL